MFPRAVIGLHFPESEYGDVLAHRLGIYTNNRAEAIACLRVLQLCPCRRMHVCIPIQNVTMPSTVLISPLGGGGGTIMYNHFSWYHAS